MDFLNCSLSELLKWIPFNRFKVYEHNQFVCTGLTLIQAQEYCKGAELVDLGIIDLCF